MADTLLTDCKYIFNYPFVKIFTASYYTFLKSIFPTEFYFKQMSYY